MADVEHNALTGASLHEPKGVAAANSNEVYVADGAASGTHKQVSPSNTVMVHSASDFPAASAGVRTLVANTIYHIVGSVSIGSDRLVGAANTGIIGNSPLTDGIVTTNSGAFFTSTFNVFMTKLFITCTSGDFLSLSGTSVELGLFEKVRVTSCDTLGTITSYGNLAFNVCLCQAAATTGLTFAGTNLFLKVIQGNYTVATGDVFDLGTATFNAIEFSGVVINNASGVTGIDIAASSANLNTGKVGTVSGCTFLTPASATTGYAVGDLQWIITSSPGIADNIGHANGNIEGSALTTVFSSTGIGNEIVGNFGTAFVAGEQIKFTVSNAGRFTYNGPISTTVSFVANIFAEISGGATRQYSFQVAKNGTVIIPSMTRGEFDGSNPGFVSCTALIDVVATDFIELYCRAETATTNLVLDTVSITVTQVGT